MFNGLMSLTAWTFLLIICRRAGCGAGASTANLCEACGLVRTKWIDREAGVKLCEHCYGRGVREKALGVGVMGIHAIYAQYAQYQMH